MGRLLQVEVSKTGPCPSKLLVLEGRLERRPPTSLVESLKDVCGNSEKAEKAFSQVQGVRRRLFIRSLQANAMGSSGAVREPTKREVGDE